MKWLLLCFTLFSSISSYATETLWKTDFPAALAQAKTQNKNVFLNFSGSDWCAGCKLWDKEVLSTPAFLVYTESKFVMVNVDFPQGIHLPLALHQQNIAVAHRYKVTNFPTVVIVDSTGKELGRLEGYDEGSGVDAVITQLKPFSPK